MTHFIVRVILSTLKVFFSLLMPFLTRETAFVASCLVILPTKTSLKMCLPIRHYIFCLWNHSALLNVLKQNSAQRGTRRHIQRHTDHCSNTISLTISLESCDIVAALLLSLLQSSLCQMPSFARASS